MPNTGVSIWSSTFRVDVKDNGSCFIEIRSRLFVDALSDSFRPEVNSAVDGGEAFALG
jgi:hypothetical protein